MNLNVYTIYIYIYIIIIYIYICILLVGWPLFTQWQSRCGSNLQPKLNVNMGIAKIGLERRNKLEQKL